MVTVFAAVWYCRAIKKELVKPNNLSLVTSGLTLDCKVLFRHPPMRIEQTATIMDEKEPIPQYGDVPLEKEIQELLWEACEETGCPYELALAVIWYESRYQNINGDDGNSIGYMQIQPKWHQDRMRRLGATDLSDPLSNFRVGCDLLSELLSKHTVEEALTCYNTGSPGTSKYATCVMEYMDKTFSTNKKN